MKVATIITYNDYPLIKECVGSLIDKVDKLVVVDGKYKDFPGELPYSDDGTMEYLYSIKDKKLRIIRVANLTEVEKRNVYLSVLDEGDIVLNLDADEVLVGDFPKIEADWGIIKLHDGAKRHVKRRASRLFRYREGMEYRFVHYTLYWQDRQINKLEKVVDPNISFELADSYIEHNWHKRSQLRRHEKSLYYKKLVRNEKGYPR